MELMDLTEEEQRLLQAVAHCEVEAGRPAALPEIAMAVGLPQDVVRAVMSRLAGRLGLLSELPGDETDGPLYSLSGRAGEPGRDAGAEGIGPNVAVQLEHCLAGLGYPAEKEVVIHRARDRGAPAWLRRALQDLPDDRRYVNLEDVADELERQLG